MDQELQQLIQRVNEAEAKVSKITSPTKSTSVVSDEDAILVQGGGPAASDQGSPSRKKKGKK